MDTENFCFCKLAPLYVLDLLSEPEKAWVEQQAAEFPEFAAQLSTYQSAAATISYSAPALPMATNLKDRLFEHLELDEPPAAAPNPAPPGYIAVRAQELNWQPHPTPGVMVAIVHQDDVKREIVGFLRAEPGVHYPWHRHAAVEEIFMMEGDLVIEGDVYGAGDYIRSLPDSGHAPYTIGGCRFFFHTSMDDEYPELLVGRP